jgi:hypothetical protein
MPNQTDKALAQIRTELLTTFSAADWESYRDSLEAAALPAPWNEGIEGLDGAAGGELRLARAPVGVRHVRPGR